MKKFKNLEDLWQFIKKTVPSGAQVTSIEKSSQQKLFYVTIPKALVTNGKKVDYSLTFMETGGDIDVFIEPTNDNFSIYDFEDLKEIMPIAIKESLNEASVYVETSSDPDFDNVIQFEYHSGRAQLQKELEDAFGKGRVKYRLVALPNHEFELYVKKDKTSQWIEFLRGGLSESAINESAYDDWRKFLAKQKCINDSDKQYVLVYPNKTKEKLYPELYQTSANKLVTNEGNGGYIVKREGATLKAIGYVGISISKYELETFIEKFGKDKVGNCKNEAEVTSFLTSIKESYMNESEAQDRYREFFENKLKQYNVSSPAELSQEQKSKFFQEVKDEWAEEKKKQGINEAFTAREMTKDMLNDFDSAEQKFIKEHIPGGKYYQVYRGKALMAAASLAKKSKRIANAPGLGGFDYTAYESPKGMRFICANGWEFGVFYIFPEAKINENYLTEAEVMKATGKLYFTDEMAGEMSGDELQNALKNLSDTMAQLSTDPTEDSIKAYKECEDSYQCLKAELLKRGLEEVN